MFRLSYQKNFQENYNQIGYHYNKRYSSSSLYLSSEIKERQIYKLGYFTNDVNARKIQSYKHGFLYYPDNSCVGNLRKITSGFFFNSIKKEDSTFNNFSEEIELLENICFNNEELQINGPSPTLHNTGYILRYKKEYQEETGFKSEAWHYRYVGVDIAKALHDKEMSYEEYYATNIFK